MLSIGELSRATALTVKTLRHYHDRGLLLPSRIDGSSGYRYYDSSAIERARIIKTLKELEFSLEEIRAILEHCTDDADTLEFIERQRDKITKRLAELKRVSVSLDQVIKREREAQMPTPHADLPTEKTLPAQVIAGIRTRGRFDLCGGVYRQLGKAVGLNAKGKPGMLIYDDEFRENDHDFEPYFVLKKDKPAAGASVREIGETRALCMVHRGPYDNVSTTYGRLFEEIQKRGLRPLTPSREVYIKGPGMIFKGNPEKYVTELQIPVAEARE